MARKIVSRVWGMLLRLPLYYKILLANAGLVFLIAIGSTAIAVELMDAGTWRSAFGSFLIIALLSVAVTLPVYGLILRFALEPLEVLEVTAARIEKGQLDSRARLSRLADPHLARLTGVFNRLLDRVVVDRDRLRDIAERAFRAQEAERSRIARELQEETAQTLSALMLRLRVARQTVDTDQRDALLTELRHGLAELADRIRDVARSLHPPSLGDLGVTAAVGVYAESLSGSSPRISVHSEDIRGLLHSDSELALYRIVLEAIDNAVRHANATELWVSFHDLGAHVEAVVEDDGSGFDLIATERLRTSLGLLGMRERALYAGGSVEIESKVGSGTRVLIHLPTAESDPLPGPGSWREPNSVGPEPLMA